MLKLNMFFSEQNSLEKSKLEILNLSNSQLQAECLRQLWLFKDKYNKIFFSYINEMAVQNEILLESKILENLLQEEISNLKKAKEIYKPIFDNIDNLRKLSDMLECEATNSELQNCIALLEMANEQMDKLPLCKHYISYKDESKKEIEFNEKKYLFDKELYRKNVENSISEFKKKNISVIQAQSNLHHSQSEKNITIGIIGLGAILVCGILIISGVSDCIMGGLMCAFPGTQAPGMLMIGAGLIQIGFGITSGIANGAILINRARGFFEHTGKRDKLNSKINDMSSLESQPLLACQ